jgi:hypothetical protein
MLFDTIIDDESKLDNIIIEKHKNTLFKILKPNYEPDNNPILVNKKLLELIERPVIKNIITTNFSWNYDDNRSDIESLIFIEILDYIKNESIDIDNLISLCKVCSTYINCGADLPEELLKKYITDDRDYYIYDISLSSDGPEPEYEMEYNHESAFKNIKYVYVNNH